MKLKIISEICLMLLIGSSLVARADGPKLKCQRNFESVAEIMTWRLTDADGKTRTEINFGSKAECEPSAEAINGDYFCSVVLRGPGNGWKEVIASFSKNAVVAVLPLTPDGEKRHCTDHLAKQTILHDHLCVGTAYDWKVMNLKTSQLIPVPFGSLADCTEAIRDGGVLLKRIPGNTVSPEYVGRPITNKLYWMAKMEPTERRNFKVGTEELQVYLGSPDDCTVDKQVAWCPNRKVILPAGTVIRAIGQRMEFLVHPSGVLHSVRNVFAEYIDFDGALMVNGEKHTFGFVLHNSRDAQ